MEVKYQRCCGVDIHKKSITACLLTGAGKEVRTFGTMTAELRRLVEWLTEATCTHVAMESTGVYWKPIYNVLEETGLTVLVVNAHHIKAVPGRKTDVKDAEWIADLLRYGLLRGSFIPDRGQRELQELIRYRRSLIQERSREVQRIQKVLEGANIKLSSVVQDVLGVSGRAMLEAMVMGSTDATELAGLAKGKLRKQQDALEAALEGLLGAHQRIMLATQLRHIDFLDEQVGQLDAQVDERLRPYQEELERLDTIPGVGRRGAEEILAAIGTDMSRFPTVAHLVSWAKLCPGLNESAGKRRTGRTGKGNPYLRATLTEAAWAASRKRDSYLRAQYYRLKARRGAKRAAIAVAHSILVSVYHILRDGTVYQDLGANYFDERSKEAAKRQAVKRLERLGFTVTLVEAA